MAHSDDSLVSAAEPAEAQAKAKRGKSWWDGPGPVMALLAFQIACTLVLLADVGAEFRAAGVNMLADLHLMPELVAVLGLAASIAKNSPSIRTRVKPASTVFVGLVLRRMLARQARLEKGLSVASGALAGLIESYFVNWGLTGAEQDVATFTIKGYSIAEIATLRGSAEGTIKTHLNAIYRKADVTGRAQLTSLLVEDLMRAPLMDPQPVVPQARRAS